ncbi:fructosamine kinase family protein [Photobacterium rosenbergii]|uniref:Fructosamine kinase family protein n=1 Tax=Photobacterium rosenbergii TaxID=294936 RepID=A0ABU3ZEE9_9GAMM|nr:fructosamine kinase family protein [Photobacterium rosenbergii]MDV5168477.1 fructosamine kinase family protein [Photobacterium rosenbergii]
MWQAISHQLSEVLDRPFKISEKEVLEGGDINECYCIGDENERYFVKLNDRERLVMFETEAESLRMLNETDCIQVPQFIHLGTTKDRAFIVLNYLPTKVIDNQSAYTLGEQLARMHAWGEQGEYGFDLDNYVGRTPQPNQWRRKWCRFFAEQRIAWQLQLCSEKGIDFGNIDTITGKVIDLLVHHQPKPSLLHGDLWHGNTALTVTGPIIFDPASYWGDRECDIAMTELFGGFPPSFYEGYQSVWPLDDGYEERKDLYNLYHVLNHCNLFGGSYITQAEQMMEKLGLK